MNTRELINCKAQLDLVRREIVDQARKISGQLEELQALLIADAACVESLSKLLKAKP